MTLMKDVRAVSHSPGDDASRLADPGRVTRLRRFFDIQLQFAAAMAAPLDLPLGEAVAQFTCLHRRLGFGRHPGNPPALRWRQLLAAIESAPDHSARLALTVDACAHGPTEVRPQHEFGCFDFDTADADGVVSIHFAVHPRAGPGPLARSEIARRRAELAAMVRAIAERQPQARRIRGTSWLYNIEAYRRLFPPAYGQSRRPVGAASRFRGLSSWGQFLDARERVKTHAANRFEAALAHLEVARPWAVFPLPALRAEAPVGTFLDHYADRSGAPAGSV